MNNYYPTLEDLLNTVPKTNSVNHPYIDAYNAIMREQKKFCETHISKDDEFDQLRYDVAESILQNLIPLWDIVGIQPIHDPEGSNYALRYRYTDEKLSLEIISQTVVTGSRKFKHTAELGESPEAIGKALAKEIMCEWVDKLRELGNAPKHVKAEHPNVKHEYIKPPQALNVTVNLHANRIADRTRRGAGNFIIINEPALKELEKSETFEIAEDLVRSHREDDQVLMNVGLINGTIKVILDANNENENGEIIVGYKGSTEVDTGLFYNPYIMVMGMGPVMNPLTFQPMNTFMTRYGTSRQETAVNYYSAFTFPIE